VVLGVCVCAGSWQKEGVAVGVAYAKKGAWIGGSA